MVRTILTLTPDPAVVAALAALRTSPGAAAEARLSAALRAAAAAHRATIQAAK